VNTSARQIFCAVADVPTGERERIFAERRIPLDLRAEVESLLHYDTDAGKSFTRRVSDAAQEVMEWGNGPASRFCGQYRLVRLLGSGGMGAVYLAERRDGEIQQSVAVKLLRADADRPEWRDRFLRERQLLAYLNHASIARLLDAGHTEDGRPYLVMEYVDGVAIDEYAAGLDLRARLHLFLSVCEGVAHAHRRLIVHRDLKPSNILVDSSGQPKLLDFGIAKLLDLTGEETQTVERLLTPNYASPEQLRGEVQTTATDVYSLGAVLHKLLTGRSPRELPSQGAVTPAAIAVETGCLDAGLPRDIAYILRKAMRPEPEERYASVDAFAADVRAFLESRPVEARSGDCWYRARRFLRRYWIPVSVAVLAAAGAAVGTWAVHRQRVIAERRFEEVRQLSNKLFDIDRSVLGLPGSTRTRQLIVDTSLEYLRRLAADAQNDPDLALDVGTAYMRVGRVQGVPISQNLGQMENAEQNLRVAEKLIHSVLRAQPGNRTAILRASQIAHDRMVLAEYRRPDTAALPLAFQSEEWLNRYLSTGAPDPYQQDQILLIGINVANWYGIKDLPERSLRLARRMIELARSFNNPRQVASSQVIVARTLRITGDLEGALAAAREAVREAATPPSGPDRVGWQTRYSLALFTEGAILGEDGAVSLGRWKEAAERFERGFRIEAELARLDPSDTKCRLSLAARGTGLAGVVRHQDPRRAVAVYDEVLARLAEVPNNSKARREEVRALVASTYPLRRLGRMAEARRRLDAAFSRLGALKLYPAEQVNAGSEADDTLRSLAEYQADNGHLERGIATYRQLLDRIWASRPEPESNLLDAADLSSLYAGMAGLYQRAGQAPAADELHARRLALWRAWERKLPGNTFVRLQLEALRAPGNST